MSTDLNSGTVTAGDDILASQYNNVRADLVRRAGDYEVSAGSSNAYTLAIDASIVTSYIDGSRFVMKANHTNDGPATLDINTIGAKSIVLANGNALVGGEIRANTIIELFYNSTDDAFVIGTPVESVLRPYKFYNWDNYPGITSEGVVVAGSVDGDPSNFCVGIKWIRSSGSQVTRVIAFNVGESGYRGYQEFLESTGDVNPSTSDTLSGAMYLDGSEYTSSQTVTEIYKDSSALSFSGTGRAGQLGYDTTNSYFLVLYSTTKIAKFTLSGSTLTNLNSDITLDTAVDNSKGFVWDDENAEIIAYDTVNNVIRRFDSSGTTIDTTPVPSNLSESKIKGVCIIDNRVHIIVFELNIKAGTSGNVAMYIDMIPTEMVRS